MRIVSWNIQATLGCDGRFDLPRIAATIKAFGELDAICLQEVSRNLKDCNGDDQKCLFEQAFPGYQSIWAYAFSRPDGKGQWQEFGNLTLVRNERLIERRTHLLPCPYVGEALQIQRSVAEAVINYQGKIFTLLNTHLAFHSEQEAQQQVVAIEQLSKNIHQRAQLFATAPADPKGGYIAQITSGEVLLCGDLNIPLGSPAYQQLLNSGFWQDCFKTITENNSARPATCGVFDAQLWPQGPHVRDYFLATNGLFKTVRHMAVNTTTDASDHQPVLLELL